MRILVLSPRIPAGIMTAAAWDAVRDAPSVVAAADGPHVHALREAGVDVTIGPRPDGDAIWVPEPGSTGWAADLAESMLDAGDGGAEGEGEFEIISGSFDPPGARFLDLVEVMDRLRRDCPWTREQTHASLAPYLAEETEETLQAIDSGDLDHLREELGDILLQVVFHAVIAGEGADPWDVDDVAAGITEKLIRRNPHVFGDSAATTLDEIAEQWERIKAEEKRGR